MRKTLALIAVLLALTPVARSDDKPAAEKPVAEKPATEQPTTRPATGPAIAAKDRATLEKEFAELLTNATLIGSYSKGKDPASYEDHYTILKAVKGEGDEWTITARIEYKGLKVPMDIKVPVKWADDTPVISITKQKIPGFGTFTARVMFYNDQYVGIWDGGSHGGQMWGHIEHAAAAKE